MSGALRLKALVVDPWSSVQSYRQGSLYTLAVPKEGLDPTDWENAENIGWRLPDAGFEPGDVVEIVLVQRGKYRARLEKKDGPE